MTEVIDTTSKTEVEAPKVETGVINNKRQHTAALKRLDEKAPLAARLSVDAADAKRDLFRACMDVRVTINLDGRPDFGGNSGIWKGSIADRLAPLFEEAGLKTVEARRTFMNSVVQNGLRGLIMEEYIVKYVKANSSEVEGTEKFKKLVRAEYTAAKRTIPKNSDYAIKVMPGQNGGGSSQTEPKERPAEQILDEAITLVHTQDAEYPLLVMLNAEWRVQTEAAAQIAGMVKGRKNTIPNRNEVKQVLRAIIDQATAMLAIADSKASEATLKTLATTAWTPTIDES